MRKDTNNKYQLRLLAGLTGGMLLGIIILQIYWLATSYMQQKARFTADIENAMIATAIKSQLTVALPRSDSKRADSLMASGLSEVITNAVSKVFDKAVNTGQTTNKSFAVTIRDSTTLCDSAFLNAFKKIAHTFDTNENVQLKVQEIEKPDISHAYILTTFKKDLATEFANRSIHIPFQLAIMDSMKHFVIATCDTTLFKKIPVKSESGYAILPDGNYIQTAFPNANIYLIRRMAWLLLITALLIIIGSVSFIYLVTLFFRQKKLAELKNDFMNNITHELKTPISSVSVALELLQDERHPVNEATKKEYFSVAQGELKRLTMLVEKVLKMAAFEKSEITINPEAFLAIAWLQEIMNSLKPVFEVNNVKITSSVTPDLLMLFADKTHLTNVLQNLLENAIKYNGKERPEINIRIYPQNGFTAIQVADNGKGIPAAYLDKVFDKFFRVPSGDRHDIKGYGLGLSYVKAVVELHSGIVSVISKEKEGTTFLIQLPVKK